ncbi:hypothetical protein [Microcoleus sp. FACHB-672]|nr:hypothetical protein [Microcoleus sp. FACHB-672]
MGNNSLKRCRCLLTVNVHLLTASCSMLPAIPRTLLMLRLF